MPMKKPLARLIGKTVVVRTGDLVYRGVLREVTEDTVSLMGATGWREIPMNRVVAIRSAEDEASPGAVRPIPS
jgi:hypothetical protein